MISPVIGIRLETSKNSDGHQDQIMLVIDGDGRLLATLTGWPQELGGIGRILPGPVIEITDREYIRLFDALCRDE